MNEPTTLTVASLVVAGLAAVAGLANAVAGVVSTWRDSRRLKLSLVLGTLPRNMPPQRGEVVTFTLYAINPARTPNLIESVRCFVDGREIRSTRSVTLAAPAQPIPPFGTVVENLILPAEPVLGQAFEKVRFEVRPTRGRRRRFTFRHSDFVLRA